MDVLTPAVLVGNRFDDLHIPMITGGGSHKLQDLIISCFDHFDHRKQRVPLERNLSFSDELSIRNVYCLFSLIPRVSCSESDAKLICDTATPLVTNSSIPRPLDAKHTIVLFNQLCNLVIDAYRPNKKFRFGVIIEECDKIWEFQIEDPLCIGICYIKVQSPNDISVIRCGDEKTSLLNAREVYRYIMQQPHVSPTEKAAFAVRLGLKSP